MFGVPYSSMDLALLPQYESEIPAGLTILHSSLRQNHGMKSEGIFRKTAKEQTFLDAMTRMDMGHSIDSIGADSFVVAQLIKAWFREYTIASPGFFTQKLLNATNDNEIKKEFNLIDEPLRSIILWTVDLCVEVSSFSEFNKMTIESLSICFSPNFIRHNDTSKLLLLQRASQSLFKRLCELRQNNELNLDIKLNDEEKKSAPSTPIKKRRASQIVYTSSVVELYRASLSTGIYGNFLYPKRDIIIHPIVRADAMDKKEKETVYESLGMHYAPCFELKYFADDENNELNLSDEEKEKILSFGNLLSSRYNYENIAYSALLRYVIGCKLRINVAEKRFLNLKKLESEYKLNDIKLTQVRDELKKECYMLCGNDLNNNAIIGFRVNKFHKKNMNISVMMKSLMVYVDAISSSIDVCRNGIVILIDCNGLNKDNLALDLEKVFISSFQDCYPMRVTKFIICDAPIIIRAAIKIGKLFLSKKLSSRIISVKSNPNNGGLWKLVDKSQIPRCLHGKYDINRSSKSLPTNAWEYVCSKVIGDINLNINIVSDEHNDEHNDNNDDEKKEEMNKSKGGRMKMKLAFSSGINKAKLGVNKAKIKMKQKRDSIKLRKIQLKEKQNPNDTPPPINDNNDEDDGNNKIGTPTKRLSFNKRSEIDYAKKQKMESQQNSDENIEIDQSDKNDTKTNVNETNDIEQQNINMTNPTDDVDFTNNDDVNNE